MFFAVLGIVLTLIGVLVALWQLVRTRRAAEAARDAIESHTRARGERDLIAQLAALSQVEDRALLALQTSDVRTLYDAFKEWGRSASVVRRKLAHSTVTEEAALVRELTAAIVLSDEAKTRLISPPLDAVSLGEIATLALSKISKCTGLLAAILDAHTSQADEA